MKDTKKFKTFKDFLQENSKIDLDKVLLAIDNNEQNAIHLARKKYKGSAIIMDDEGIFSVYKVKDVKPQTIIDALKKSTDISNKAKFKEIII